MALDAPSVRAVDAHAHVLRRDAPLAPDRHSAPRHDATVEQFLGVLDAHGVSHAVLTAPSFYGTDNRILLSAIAAAPARLRGTVIVAPDVDRATLDAYDRSGIVGIRFNWIRRDTLPDLEAYDDVLASVRALGWHVEIYLEGPKLASVLPALRARGVPVVVDHFGSPDPAHGVRCAGFQEVLRGVRAGDTWVKLSAPYRQGQVDPQRYVDALLDANTARLVWASDWPFVSFEDAITYRRCVDWLQTWIPDPATRRAILADTPARLFRFGGERS